MRRATALLSAAAIVLSAVSLSAQAKPSFAGSWVREAPAGGAPGGGGGGGGRGGGGGMGFGMNPTITQSATDLVVSYAQGENTVKLTFKLDGTATKNTMQGRGGPMEQESKATWTGDKLTIVTTTANGEQKRVIGLEGGNLVIEQTNPGREGGAPTTAKVVYKKG